MNAKKRRKAAFEDPPVLMNIKLTEELRAAFLRYCQSKETTTSEVLRTFMHRELERAGMPVKRGY